MAGPNDIALVVGIDEYGAHSLPSCVNDAAEIARLLETNGTGTPNFTVEKLLKPAGAAPLTRLTFLSQLSKAVAAVPSYDFLFYFSGHGSTSDWGSELVLSENNDAVNLLELMHIIYKSRARHVAVILDCCFSGSFGLMPALGGDPTGFEPGFSLIRDNVTLLAASKASQTAAAGTPYSAFTEKLIDGLNGQAADGNGNITAPGLFGFAASAFAPLGQRPVMKASVSTTEPLRSVALPAAAPMP